MKPWLSIFATLIGWGLRLSKSSWDGGSFEVYEKCIGKTFFEVDGFSEIVSRFEQIIVTGGQLSKYRI